MARLVILEARPVGKFIMEMRFNDNTIQRVDIGDFILRHPHPQYDKYLNEEEFLKYTLDDGNIVWGEDWDLVFPIEQLHAGVIQ